MNLDNGAVEIFWCGHAAFRMRHGSHSFYVDPFLRDNPRCPSSERQAHAVEAIFLTHAHANHAGDTVAISKAQPAKIVSVWEVASWLKRKGVAPEQLITGNVGGSVEVAGVRAHLVHATHSGGIFEGDRPEYCGKPVGYVFDFPSGARVYHAGDTGLFGDMELIGRLYHPDLALLPIDGFSTMGPREAAHACRLLGVRAVVPMHYGTFPGQTGTPEELRRQVEGNCEVIELVPGARMMWEHGGWHQSPKHPSPQ